MLVEPLLQVAHEQDGDDHGDDVALVALEVDVIEAEELHLRDVVGGHDGVAGGLRGGGEAQRGGSLLGADDQVAGGAGDGPGVHQRRVVHDHADDAAEVLVAAEDAGGGEADEDLQEDEGGVGEGVDKNPPGIGGEGAAHGVVETLGEAHEQAGGHDGRDDGDEDVAQQLGGLLDGVALGSRGRLRLVLGGGGETTLLHELVVDLVDGARTVDDLQLTGGREVALGTDRVLDLLLVDLAVVGDDQAHTRGAVCVRYDVLGTAHCLKQLFCRLCMIQSHISPLPHR